MMKTISVNKAITLLKEFNDCIAYYKQIGPGTESNNPHKMKGYTEIVTDNSITLTSGGERIEISLDGLRSITLSSREINGKYLIHIVFEYIPMQKYTCLKIVEV